MARRRRKSHRRRSRRRSVAANPRRHRRTTHRRRHSHARRRLHRNPGFSTRGIVGQVKTATVNAAQILVGEAATNVVSSKIPFGPTTGPVALAKQVAVGAGLAVLVRRFAGERFALNFLTGAIYAPLRAAVKSLNVPVISSGLSAYVQPLPTGRGISAYVLPSGMNGMGELEDEQEVYAQMYGA